MLFQSFAFIAFLLIIWICYWKMPPHYRWCLMLAAGCFYYSLWNVKYIVLVFTTDIIFELAVLFIFKYLGFFGEIYNDILLLLGSSAQISIFQLVLPVGISFYIFQTLAYVIDVYMGKISAERHFGYFLPPGCRKMEKNRGQIRESLLSMDTE